MSQSIAITTTTQQWAQSAWRNFVIATIAFLTLVDLFAAQAILPALARAYNVSPGVIGLAVNACTLGMAIASFATALVSARIERRAGIVVALCILAALTLLLGFANDIVIFSSLRVLQGLCMAAAFSLTLAYLGENCASHAAGGAFAAYIAGNVASNLFGRLASASLVEHAGLRGNFIALTLLNLVGAAIVLASIRSARRQAMTYSPGEGLAGVRANLRRPEQRVSYFIGFCILFAFIGAFTFVNFVLARPPISLAPETIGLVYFVFAPSLITTPLAGRAVVVFGAKRSMLAGLGLAVVGLPLLLSTQLPVLLSGLTLVGVGTFFAQAVTSGYVTTSARENRGAASGLYLAAYFSGGLAGAAILGPVFESFGWGACVAGVAVALVCAAAAAARLR